VRKVTPASVELPAQYRQAMHRLSHRRREVLERYVYRRMKPVEIAADLNITPGCARVHLHLAYKDLATLLGITNYKIVVELLKPLCQPR
jgi:DNA-directed RNA polymerase specialized sigma24 family protein